nr:single-stranded DNA-binding protein [uncultured Actinotalea sp.]
MSSNGLTVTVVGWAATTPREISGDGVPYTSFRVATTPRWFDSRAGAWTDGRTEWITVKAFRDVALNVGSSIRKGDPVLVTGRLRTEEWQGETGPRTSLVLDVTALGHDLTRGRAVFTRTVNVAAERASAEAGADGGASGPGRSGAGGGGPEEDPWATDGGRSPGPSDEFAEEHDDPEVAGDADGSALAAGREPVGVGTP